MSVVSLVVRLVDEFSSKVPAIVNGIDKIDGRGRGAGGGSGSGPAPSPSKPPSSPGGGGSGGGGPSPRTPGGGGGGAPDGKGGGKRTIGLAAGAGGLAVASAKLKKSAQQIRDAVARTAAFDDMLEGIARTGDMTDAQLASLRSTILNLGPVLGRLPTQIAEVANELVAAGISPDRAEKMLAPIGRVAVATRSEIGHINKAALAMAQNLGIAADEIESTFDKIWTAAKRGNFELKDMAQFLPAIAAAASSRGMTGIGAAVELAAAAQIVREGAGSPGSAATNLKELLMKMTAPQTVKKFAKYGVDLKEAMAKGLAEGRSPLETIILETRKLLEKHKGLTVGDLIQDSQAQLALSKLVEKFDEFIAIREEASKATGTIASDFAKMASTMQASLDRLAASIDRREKMFGQVAAPFERFRSGLFTRLNNWLADLAERFPRLAGGVGAVGLAFGDLASIVSSVWPTLLGLASSIALIKFSGVGRAIAGLGRAFGRLGMLIFRGLMFAKGFVSGFASAFVRELAPLTARLGPLFARLGPAILAGLAAVGPLLLRGLGMLARIFMGPAGWALIAGQLAWSFRNEIGSALSGIASWFQERFQSLFGGISLADIGAKLMQSLLDGLKRAAESVIGWASGFAGRLKGLFSFGGGASSPPAAIPQSYRPTGLTAAPSRQASVTFNNTFTVNGGADPEGAARRILAALDRQRQAGLYDGALA